MGISKSHLDIFDWYLFLRVFFFSLNKKDYEKTPSLTSNFHEFFKNSTATLLAKIGISMTFFTLIFHLQKLGTTLLTSWKKNYHRVDFTKYVLLNSKTCKTLVYYCICLVTNKNVMTFPIMSHILIIISMPNGYYQPGLEVLPSQLLRIST